MQRSLIVFIGCVGLSAVCGCTAKTDAKQQQPEEVGQTDEAIHTFRFTVFDNPYGNGIPNPLQGIIGNATGYIATNPNAVSGLKEWTVTGLDIYNVPKNRTFGAHAHALTCDDAQGGGHYENIPGSTDPVNSEIWLDFTTDDNGHGRVKVVSPFGVRPGGVQSIVIHTDPTDPSTGKAGAKLACANFALSPTE